MTIPLPVGILIYPILGCTGYHISLLAIMSFPAYTEKSGPHKYSHHSDYISTLLNSYLHICILCIADYYAEREKIINILSLVVYI